MGYAQPAFMVDHPANVVGIGGFDSDLGSSMGDAGHRSLIDFRPASIAAFGNLETPQAVDIDFGVAITHNRLVIPVGHDFAGATLSVHSDDNPAFSSWVTHFSTTAEDGIVDFNLASPSTSHQYWRILWADLAGSWEMGQLWLGTRTQLTSAVHVQPDWDAENETPRVQQEFGSRVSTLVLGPTRRKFSLEVMRVDPSTADYALLWDVARTGAMHPFYYWPPDTKDPGPFLVMLDGEASIVQGYSKPAKAIQYTFRFDFIEVVA